MWCGVYRQDPWFEPSVKVGVGVFYTRSVILGVAKCGRREVWKCEAVCFRRNKHPHLGHTAGVKV